MRRQARIGRYRCGVREEGEEEGKGEERRMGGRKRM